METDNGDMKSKLDDYEVIEQIGRGAFGAAFLVLHKIERKKSVILFILIFVLLKSLKNSSEWPNEFLGDFILKGKKKMGWCKNSLFFTCNFTNTFFYLSL